MEIKRTWLEKKFREWISQKGIFNKREEIELLRTKKKLALELFNMYLEAELLPLEHLKRVTEEELEELAENNKEYIEYLIKN